ncbi:MAG TPA: chemotaxis-specific protein-glutamate methyltransferase CheB [Polyangiaceae bacterium]|jgi:two-component system chemotaxis response regulator CheB|nr:chemotaxis-specific protein-glutamate methyltransferase CheB [Polyangiaceae bacterium]
MIDLNTPRIRVLVVDDSATARRLIANALSGEPDFDIVGFAENGRQAIERVSQDRPDVVVLDLEMPEMSGLAALGELKRRDAFLPVVVFSSQTQRGAASTVDALLAGADDYASKPSGAGAEWAAVQVELVAKLRAVAGRVQRPITSQGPTSGAVSVRSRPAPRVPVRAVAIGTSAGGPEALALLLPRFSGDLRVPLFIVQHMPSNFTAALAKRLNEKSSLRVVEANQGQLAQPGIAYLAPGDFHLKLVRRHGTTALLLDKSPPEHGCRPSVDSLFRSAAEVYGSGLLALVLTGMGSDGLEGARAVNAASGNVWIQDEASAMIWGMPGAVARAGLARRTCSLLAMPQAVEAAVAQGLPVNRDSAIRSG